LKAIIPQRRVYFFKETSSEVDFTRFSPHKNKPNKISKSTPLTMPKSKRVSDELTTVPPKATSPGEELYLVHLQRHAGEVPSEDDFDHEGRPRKRSHSVGEELWGVHLRRSQGLPEDLDDEANYEKKAEDKKKVQGESPRPCRYNLRSKDQHAVKGQ
jgi:hypothetical protein